MGRIEAPQPKETDNQESALVVFIPHQQFNPDFPDISAYEQKNRRLLTWKIQFIGLDSQLNINNPHLDLEVDEDELTDGILLDKLLNFLNPAGKPYLNAKDNYDKLYKQMSQPILYELHIKLSALACQKIKSLQDRQPSPIFNGNVAKILKEANDSTLKLIRTPKNKRYEL